MTSTTTSRLQGVVASLGIKAPVRTVTSDNITLSGTQTVNAVSVVTDDRVLVKDQTDGTENGIYNVSTGLWVRAPDFNGVLDAVPGVMVAVSEGSGAGLLYRLSTTGDIVVGTTSLSFTLMTQLSTSAFGQTLVQAIDAAAALVLLNLGSEVQAWDAQLDTLATVTATTATNLTTASVGEILYHDGTDWVILTAGTDGYHLRAKGAAAPVWEPSGNRGAIGGLVLSNDTDTSHDINVTAGVATTADHLSTMTLATEQTKQIDVSWATGNDAGGFPSSLQGVGVIANTWYHVHLFTVGSTVEVGFDSSITADNLIADHGGAAGKYRRIGSVLTDGTTPGNILQFYQYEEHFWWDLPINDITSVAVPTTETAYTLSVPENTLANIAIRQTVNNSQTAYGHIRPTDLTDSTPTVSALANAWSSIGAEVGANRQYGTHIIKVDGSRQINIRYTASLAPTFSLVTQGWIDTRGRNL